MGGQQQAKQKVLIEAEKQKVVRREKVLNRNESACIVSFVVVRLFRQSCKMYFSL